MLNLFPELLLIPISIKVFVFLVFLVFLIFLNNEEKRKKLIVLLKDSLNKGIEKRYKKKLTSLLKKIEKFWGESFSNKAFKSCLNLALFYPFILFLISYSFFNGAFSFSGFEVVSKTKDINISIPIFIALSIYLIKYLNDIKKHLSDIKKYEHIKIIILSCSFAISSTCIYNAGNFSAIFIFLTILLTNRYLDVFSVFGGIVISTILILTILYLFFDPTYAPITIFIFIFFIIFPILNAFLDWLSLGVSQSCLDFICKSDSIQTIVTDISADIILAFIFMMILILSLPFFLEWVNLLCQYGDFNIIIDWRTIAEEAVNDPWRKGLLVTAMFITTLLPTLIHLLIGLFIIIEYFVAYCLLLIINKKNHTLQDAALGVLFIAVVLPFILCGLYWCFALLPIIGQCIYDLTIFIYSGDWYYLFLYFIIISVVLIIIIRVKKIFF